MARLAQGNPKSERLELFPAKWISEIKLRFFILGQDFHICIQKQCP